MSNQGLIAHGHAVEIPAFAGMTKRAVGRTAIGPEMPVFEPGSACFGRFHPRKRVGGGAGVSEANGVPNQAEPGSKTQMLKS